MSDPNTEGNAVQEPPRWPRIVSTLGVIVGGLTIVDKLDDLLLPLVWPVESWSQLLEPEVAEFVRASIPPPGWIAFFSVVGLALGILLVFGSLRLRRERRSGIKLCRVWAGLSITWHLVSLVAGVVWLLRNRGQLTQITGGGWQGPAILGIGVAMAILLVFPVFLLWWLAQPHVREEYASWDE